MTEPTTVYHMYQFDPKTGHIDAHVWAALPHDHPDLNRANQVVATEAIPYTHTATEQDGTTLVSERTMSSGGWFILDENGQPTTDAEGNHLYKPPVFFVHEEPHILHHILVGQVAAGHVKVEHLSGNLINEVNRAFVNAGLPVPLPGTAHIPAPVHTAKTRSASVKPAIPKG